MNREIILIDYIKMTNFKTCVHYVNLNSRKFTSPRYIVAKPLPESKCSV